MEHGHLFEKNNDYDNDNKNDNVRQTGLKKLLFSYLVSHETGTYGFKKNNDFVRQTGLKKLLFLYLASHETGTYGFKNNNNDNEINNDMQPGLKKLLVRI